MGTENGPVVSRGGEDMPTHEWHQGVCGVMGLSCVLIVVVAALRLCEYRTVPQEKRSVVSDVNFLKNTFCMAKRIISKFKRQMTELEKVFI